MPENFSVLNVEGMTCSHCENVIKNSVVELKGVNGVIVDMEAKKVTIDYDLRKVSLETIKQAIEDQGYDVKSSRSH